MSQQSPDRGGVSLGGLRRQCLFAVTILLVEDSRSASEAIRLFAAESGARVRRADSLHAASRHLAIYRPNVLIIDLGLPDGDGMELIRQLSANATPISGVIAMSGHDRAAWREQALEAGAAACLEKPITSLRAFQECILSVLPDSDSRRGPDDRQLALMDRVSIRAALTDDLKRAKALLDEGLARDDGETTSYCAQFLSSVGDMLQDKPLYDLAHATFENPEKAARLSEMLSIRLHPNPDSAKGVA